MAAINDRIWSPKVVTDLDRSVALATEARLPVEVVNTLRVFRASVPTPDARGRPIEPNGRDDAMALLATDRVIAADPLAQNTAILLGMPLRPEATDPASRIAVFTRVADDQRLGVNHPLRQLALLRLANLALAANDPAGAQRYFERTGLTAEQCALVGATPALRSSGASGADYPTEALRMGFEGWVRLEFDITAEGRTTGPRALIAYPPFVFVDAATQMTKNIRYQASYRPGGGAACSAQFRDDPLHYPTIAVTLALPPLLT